MSEEKTSMEHTHPAEAQPVSPLLTEETAEVHVPDAAGVTGHQQPPQHDAIIVDANQQQQVTTN